MAHVDDGQLNALLDGELSPEIAREVETHVAGCAECARRLEEARAFLTEAGELLNVLTPPARAAEPVKAEAAPPLIARTAKEIAVSVDGRTEMTPAIRPVFKHEVPPPARRRWTMPDLEKMAWAASLVLCLGVGYLANEVYHLKQAGRRQDAQAPSQTAAAVNSQEPAASAAEATGPTVAPSDRPSARRSGSLPARPSAGAAAERSANVAAPSPKPPESKPPPAFARAQPEQIASTTQPTAAPVTTAAPAAPAPASSLGDLAGAAAPRAAAPSAGAGARAEERASLDEAGALSRNREMTSATFRRATMEEAVRHLSGSIRLIDGMNPSRVEVGPGRLVSGADPARDVVRVTYTSGTSRLILDQQLGEAGQGGAFNGLMPGDTLVTALGSNGTQVRWLDRKFWLSLTGGLAADSMRAIVERVR